MRLTLFALFLFAESTAAIAAEPILSIALEDSIPQPGHNGKGKLIRPLVLYIANWSARTPQIHAYTYGEEVQPVLADLRTAPDKWSATVRYTVIEATNRTAIPLRLEQNCRKTNRIRPPQLDSGGVYAQMADKRAGRMALVREAGLNGYFGGGPGKPGRAHFRNDFMAPNGTTTFFYFIRE